MSEITELMMGMYVNEPCRICGKNIKHEDLKDLIFAGYGKAGRTAHKKCWADWTKKADRSMWFDPVDD